MKDAYYAVRLMQNRSYPTYQLCAQMANKKTKPEEGLLFAALTTLQWIKLRLGEHAPPEWERLPEPERYFTSGNDCLISRRINNGYIIDIMAIPEQGIWSMQILEPDLGSDSEYQAPKRPPVAGRVIETNVSFRIVGSALHCDFQTIISEPESTADRAEVYRMPIIQQLANAPMFGLKQIIPLTEKLTRITRDDLVKRVMAIWHSADNYLPCVIFSQVIDTTKEIQPQLVDPPSLPSTPIQFKNSTIYPYFATDVAITATSSSDSRLSHIMIESTVPKKEKRTIPLKKREVRPAARDPAYNIELFAKDSVTLCRTYLLEESHREQFERLSGLHIRPGDTVVLEPDIFGGKTDIYPLKQTSTAQKETIDLLYREMHNYLRGKEIPFDHNAFLPAAREMLLCQMEDLERQSKKQNQNLQQRLEMLREEWKTDLAIKDSAYAALAQQLERQRDYQTQLEAEKSALREQLGRNIAFYRRLLAQKEEYIRYLHRKLMRPPEHSGISAWVREQLAEHLILHRKAVNLLNDRAARTVNVGLICDALDFLATDYWERRYLQISEEEMLTRCSEKYGRPFDIAPSGAMSIEMLPGEYKIKYYRNEKGKAKESALDYHLRVGNDMENLLRIYFLHDDAKRLIVVGSLPRHLKTATIQ